MFNHTTINNMTLEPPPGPKEEKADRQTVII